MMLRTAFIVADKTASIEITVWGPPDQITVGMSYDFRHLTVQFFGSKKLSTTVESIINRVEDIKDVSTTPLVKPKRSST